MLLCIEVFIIVRFRAYTIDMMSMANTEEIDYKARHLTKSDSVVGFLGATDFVYLGRLVTYSILVLFRIYSNLFI